MQEQRSEPRRKTLLGAQINLTAENATAECLVRNLSAGGAKLMLIGKKTLPEEFGLSVTAKGTSYVAEVKWRHNNVLGVALRPNLRARVISLEEERRRRAPLAE